MYNWVDEAIKGSLEKYLHSAQLAKTQDVIPYVGKANEWEPSPKDGDSWWTNGFYPGIMWQLNAISDASILREEAIRVEKRLIDEIMHFTGLNHDVGLMYMPSVGAHYKVDGDETAKTHLLHAASLLLGRFNLNGFISAWNGNKPGWAIIDCLMNIPLLYQATELTGDPRYKLIAMCHADTSIKHFLREDGSCNHIVIFDPWTGEVLEKPAGQGYAVGSSWSRGQAWALYGFTLSYMHTKEKRYLEAACRVANYFISNIREDGLTDSDFCQPKTEERIDNIAGAVAASGLLSLAKLCNENQEKYETEAMRMLQALHTKSANYSLEEAGILQQCTASYHDDGAGRHVNIVYGDYFFIEALAKCKGHDLQLWL